MKYIIKRKPFNHVIRNLSGTMLFLWCLLPAAMSIILLILGILKKLPSKESVAAKGRQLGSVVYSLTVNIYRGIFFTAGTCTIIIAVILLILALRRLISRKAVHRIPWFYFLAALLLWSSICTVLAENHYIAFWGESYLNDGFVSYCIYAAVFICAASVFREKSRRFILRLYSAVVCCLALFMVLQQLDIDFLNYCFPSARAVVFNQFNHFGYILCMAIMALWGLYIYDAQAKNWLKALYLIGFAFLSYALMLNDTFGAYLAVFAALPIVYIFYYVSGRKAENQLGNLYVFAPLILFLLISVMNMAGLLPFADSLSQNVSTLGSDVVNTIENNEEAAHAGTERLSLWKDTLERIKERPIFGFGPMGFSGEHVITNNDVPHNEYLQIAGYLGIPGLLLYLAALISLLVHHWKNMKKLDPMVLAVSGCTVGYLISACFGNPVFNTAPYYWMFLGLTTATCEKDGSVFAIDENIIERVRASGISVKKILIPVIAAAVVLGGGLTAQYFLTAETEADREQSDLENMQCAILSGKLKLKNKKLEETTTYWFDFNSLSLIDSDESQPAAYGEGTDKAGGGKADFEEETGLSLDYDETQDYSGKILQVIVDPDAETVILNWCSVDGDSSD